jgi:non-heme chloroperoxidase
MSLMRVRSWFGFMLLMLSVFAGSGSGQGQGKQSGGAQSIVEGNSTTSAGIRIHYLQTGDSKSARALVLIPGWRLPAFLWNEQLTKFAPTIRVIAIDPRSQGDSTKTPDGNTPESRARDLHEILANLGVSSPILVGWSQGAHDVSAYVQQFGNDSVAGVVIVDTSVSAGAAELEIHKEFSKVILTGMATYARYPKEYSEGMVRAIIKKPLPDAEVEKIVKFTLQTPTDSGIAMLAMDIFGADRGPALAKLNKPALVVVSAESPMLDAAKQMAATISGAKFLAIEGAGHAVFVDQPEKFDAALEAFLKEVSH